jgi:hypothetical protein
MFKHKNLKPRYKVMEITKTKKGVIYVPPLGINHQHNLQKGIYEWEFIKLTIKFGLFGEGVSSNASSRYADYRTVGKNLWKYEGGENGSVKSIKMLDKILKVNESINVYFYEVINPTIEIDGVRYDINLACIEKEAKEEYKDTLILT